MSTKQYGEGKTISVVAPTGGYASGALVIIRSGNSGMCGVVVADIAAAASGAVIVEGEFTLPANAGTGLTFAHGDILYRKASDATLTKSATSNTKVGFCTLAKAAAATTGRVKLIPA